VDRLSLGRERIGWGYYWWHRELLGIEPGCLEHEHLQLCPRAGRRIEPVPATDDAQLVAAQLAEDRRQLASHLPRELRDEAVLTARHVMHLAPEEAAKLEQTRAVQGSEDRSSARRPLIVQLFRAEGPHAFGSADWWRRNWIPCSSGPRHLLSCAQSLRQGQYAQQNTSPCGNLAERPTDLGFVDTRTTRNASKRRRHPRRLRSAAPGDLRRRILRARVIGRPKPADP
jgi:hypothetical protein